jgi:hypothetical protein
MCSMRSVDDNKKPIVNPSQDAPKGDPPSVVPEGDPPPPSTILASPHGIIVVNIEQMSLEELEEVQAQFQSMVQRRKRERNETELAIKRRKVDDSTSTVVSDSASSSTENALSSKLPAIPIPPEVLRMIARSGFLRSQDLGKLLLLTSKSILHALTPAFVYNLLYETRLKDRWASPTRGKNEWVPLSVLQARGHESVLKSMEAPPVVKTRILSIPSMPNSKSALHPNNTVVILSFWILSQKIYSHQLTQDEMKDLTKTGHCDLSSQESLFKIINLCFEKNKTFSQKLKEIRQKNHAASSHQSDTDPNTSLVVAKIHGIRLDTNQTCTFYDSNLPRFELQRTHAEDNQVKFPIQRALRNTDQGDRWIAQWFHHGWPEGIQNFGGLTFSVTLKKNEIHIESIVFGEPGRSEHLQTRHGISPFHIMEGLAGWQ